MNLVDKVKLNNPSVINLIDNAFKQNKISHSYIFAANESVEVEAEPMLLINSIIEGELTSKDNSKYSDLHIIDGSDSLIKKDQVISAMETMMNSALDAKGIKILLIKNIENGNKQSLNSLLKFIEEPTPNTFIVITSNNLNGVINTIKSRSQIINIKSESFESIIEAIDIEEPYKSMIGTISSSKEEAKKIAKSKKTIELIDNIRKAFINGADSKSSFIIELNKLIIKTKEKQLIKFLKVVINDI